MPDRLVALGSNGSGQLARADLLDTREPHQILMDGGNSEATHSLEGVTRVAAGGNHTVLLCGDGRMYTVGKSSDGRLGEYIDRQPGIVQEVDLNQPSQPSSKCFSHIAATWSASFFVCDDRVYSCGSGNNGELGQGLDVTHSQRPTMIANLPPEGLHIVQLQACMAHVVVILSDGTAYGWGRGRQGQIGEPAVDAWTPRRIGGITFPAVRAAAGKDFSCFIGESSSGDVTVLGCQKNDRFGVRSNAPRVVPDWSLIAASWGSVYILTQSGKIVAWGRDDHGQLPPQELPPIMQLAAGSEHCVALTTERKVLTWGWGEHGNCGDPVDERGDVRGRCNELRVPDTAVSVFAGCATTFIATKTP